MNELLIKLKEQLLAIVKEIDNFNIPLDNTIFINKEDFKWIRYIGGWGSTHAFEYKDSVQFTFRSEGVGMPYEKSIYEKLMQGKLEILILNKKERVEKMNGFVLNYILESEQSTILRNLYKVSKRQEIAY